MAKSKRSGGGGGGSSSGGESNTGLIVALVFFILATITLGVLTYFGYSGQTDLLANEKKAKKELAKANQDLAAEKVQKLALRVAIGVDEANDLKTLNEIKGGSGTKDAFEKQIGALRDLPKWDAASDRPAKTYTDVFTEKGQEATKADNARKQTSAASADAQKNWESEKADLEAKLRKAQEGQKNAGDATVQAQQRKYEELDAANTKIKELSEQIAKNNQTIQDNQVDADRKINSLQAAVDKLEKARGQVNQRIGPLMEKLEEMKNRYPDLVELAELHRNLANYFDQIDLVASDTPKGEIIRVDRTSKLLYVNLGSDDRVKTQMTFSVLPKGLTKKAGGRERKGAIEIVSVEGPRLSKARIIEEPNSLRNPISQGDELYNPTYRPGQREHVAIAGLIDFLGDGRDHTPEIVAELTRQGVIVDAYLDSSDLTIKGSGMSEKTTFLIKGDRSQVGSNLPPTGESGKILDVANEYNKKLRDMEEQAKTLGVQTVTARRFLQQTGFPLPRGNAKGDFGSVSYLQKAINKANAAPSETPK